MTVTNRDDEYHSILLTGKLFACCCQSRIPNRNKLETRRRLPLFGELAPDQCLGSLERRGEAVQAEYLEFKLLLLFLVLNEFEPRFVLGANLWFVGSCHQAWW